MNVRDITVRQRIVGGHEKRMTRTAVVAGVGGGAVGTGALAVAGIICPPAFFLAVGGIVLGGLVKGRKNGRRMDRDAAQEIELDYEQWTQIPEVCRAIQEAVAVGERRASVQCRYETDKLLRRQEVLGGGKGYVAVEYAIEIG